MHSEVFGEVFRVALVGNGCERFDPPALVPFWGRVGTASAGLSSREVGAIVLVSGL